MFEEADLITKEERELLNEILDDQEVLAIQHFCENERMLEAVKKVLLVPMYSQGVMRKGKKARPRTNWALNGNANTNENLGAMIRGYSDGIHLVEKGFKVLSLFKKKEDKVEVHKNQAR